MKTSTVKLSNTGYLFRFGSKQGVPNLAELRVLPVDFKDVHKPGQVPAEEISGLFATGAC